MIHVLVVQVLDVLVLLFHLLIIVNRIAVEHLQIGFMNLVKRLHGRTHKLQFVLYIEEVILLILNLTHIGINEANICLNLLHRLAELLIFVVTKERSGSIEVVVFCDCSSILSKYILGCKRTTEDALTLCVITYLIVDFMNLSNGK